MKGGVTREKNMGKSKDFIIQGDQLLKLSAAAVGTFPLPEQPPTADWAEGAPRSLQAEQAGEESCL